MIQIRFAGAATSLPPPGPGLLKRAIADYLGPDLKRVDDPARELKAPLADRIRRWQPQSARLSLVGFYPYHYDPTRLENKHFPNAFGKTSLGPASPGWKDGGV